MAAPSVGFLDHHLSLLPVHEHQEECAHRKENAIHDAKSKAGLQHGTLLVDRSIDAIAPINTVTA